MWPDGVSPLEKWGQPRVTLPFSGRQTVGSHSIKGDNCIRYGIRLNQRLMRKFLVSFIAFYLSLLGLWNSFPVLSNVFVYTLIQYFFIIQNVFFCYLLSNCTEIFHINLIKITSLTCHLTDMSRRVRSDETPIITQGRVILCYRPIKYAIKRLRKR